MMMSCNMTTFVVFTTICLAINVDSFAPPTITTAPRFFDKCIHTNTIPLHRSSLDRKLATTTTLPTNIPRKRTSTTQLNGIKGFRGWFESTFPNAMTPITTAAPNRSGPNSDKPTHTDTFDHVLIDVNQLLHVALRRARNEGHALTMVLKELDKCIQLAQPTQSVVLALDGPPSAAKLATQRRRRYGTVVRATMKRERRKILEERMLERRSQFLDENSNALSSEFDMDPNMSLLFPNNHSRQPRRHRDRLNEEATLCITPGTAFMDRAADAILYWAWQRLTNPMSQLCIHNRNVKVYLSTSDAPGEGEVKLLDWVFQLGSSTSSEHSAIGRTHRHKQVIKPGDSIAIMGGDSDLVLEGLILPPSITHNVFVILPDGSKKSYAVSLWETTLELLRFLPKQMNNVNPSFTQEDFIMNLRTDLVLLLIMNGNDYLPKLRGSSGFDKLFHTYLKLLKRWLDVDNKKNKQRNKNTDPALVKRPFLINMDTLSFNIPFCLAFFRKLARTAPKLVETPEEMLPYSRSNSVTPLSNLNTMMDSGFIPKPARWNVIRPKEIACKNSMVENSDSIQTVELDDLMNDSVHDSNNNDGPNDTEQTTTITNEEEDSSFDDEKTPPSNSRPKHEIVQLILGEPNSTTTPYYIFEVNHRVRTSLKTTKHRLASMAMDELLGSDWRDLNEYSLGNDLEDGDDDDEVDGDDDDIYDAEDDLDLGSMSVAGYSWEVQGPVECDVEQYLAGILWNLQTYQDGVCADYAYNYGRRMSPTAVQIVEYIQEFKQQNKPNMTDRIGREELLGDNFTEPLDSGLSCLAALPAQAKHLVPEPYNLLTSNDTVEAIYEECMDSRSNVFDIKRFRERCSQLIEEKMETLSMEDPNSNHSTDNGEKEDMELKDLMRFQRGRKIRTSSKYWTVLSQSYSDLEHPFAPPEPFSERLSYLRANKRIKATRLWATEEPKWRTSTDNKKQKSNNKKPNKIKNKMEKMLSAGDVKETSSTSINLLNEVSNIEYKVAYRSARMEKDRKKKKIDGKVHHRRRINGDKPYAAVEDYEQPPSTPTKKMNANTEFLSALSSLQCLIDANCIPGPIEWSIEPCATNHTTKGEEIIRIVIGGDDGLASQTKREVNGQKRKEIKQNLASNVLDEIIGSNWQKMTLDEMKKSVKVEGT